MSKLRKLFFNINMTYKKVILFAVITGVFTALMLIIPFTASTSLANMGVTFECWILFALIIIINCEKPLEAGIKTFIFFLISQPLIYLLQVPFSSLGFGIFIYYPRWFVWTLLCLPGGMLAWLVKKDNILSAIILSVATGYLGIQGIYFLQSTLKNPPEYLLSVIFCFALAVLLILILLRKVKTRIIAFAVTVAACICFVVYSLTLGNTIALLSTDYTIGKGSYTIDEASGDDIGEFKIDSEEPETLNITADKYGTAELTLKDENGNVKKLIITYDPSGLVVNNEKID